MILFSLYREEQGFAMFERDAVNLDGLKPNEIGDELQFRAHLKALVPASPEVEYFVVAIERSDAGGVLRLVDSGDAPSPTAAPFTRRPTERRIQGPDDAPGLSPKEIQAFNEAWGPPAHRDDFQNALLALNPKGYDKKTATELFERLVREAKEFGDSMSDGGAGDE